MARRGANQVAAILGTQDLSSVELVVDVGGGRGAMLAGLLTASPGMRGIVADRADVAAEAQTYLDDAGLGDRAQGEAADFFTSVPGGGDVYVVANVLHDWADDEAVRILRTIRAAMGATARLWIVEHVLDSPDRDFEQLRDLHLVDLHMLVMFGARERTSAEYDALLLSQRLRSRRPRHDAPRMGRHRGPNPRGCRDAPLPARCTRWLSTRPIGSERFTAGPVRPMTYTERQQSALRLPGKHIAPGPCLPDGRWLHQPLHHRKSRNQNPGRTLALL